MKFVGGQITTITDKNPAYTAENPFLASGVSVKMADTVAGLNSSQKISAQSFKITITKGLESILALGSTNVDSIHNTVLEVKGDMELVYNSDNYMQKVVDGRKQALQVVMQSNDKIGATKKAELGIEVPRVALSEWKKSSDADKIVTQTVGFTGTFDIATAKTLSAWLQNTFATKY